MPKGMYKRPWKLWLPHWRQRNNLRIFWYTVLTLILAMALPYSIINQIMGYFGNSVIDPITPVDSMIPFIGWTFVIYVSLYLTILLQRGSAEKIATRLEKCSLSIKHYLQ